MIGLGDYTSFSDESDLTSRYMVIGGISCGTAFIHDLYRTIDGFSKAMPFGETVEWKNITKKNDDIFRSVIDYFCAVNSEHLVDFHALVVDMHRFDHNTFNHGDREISFDKMMFQSFFALHKRYEGANKIRCFHGRRDARYPIYQIHTMLNNKTMPPDSRHIYAPYVTVDYLEVKKSPALQLADLLIGCVGASWNRRKGYVSGSPKDRVAKHFLAECPARVLNRKTPYTMPHFDIWEFRVGGSRA